MGNSAIKAAALLAIFAFSLLISSFITAPAGYGGVSTQAAIQPAEKLMMATATPVIIAYEPFSSLKSWTSSGTWTNSTAGAINVTSAYCARAGALRTINRTVSTEGYTDINVSFRLNTALLTGTGEYLRAAWYNGTSWIALGTWKNTNATQYVSYVLPTSANSLKKFAINFSCNTTATTGHICRVDDLRIAGIIIPSSPQVSWNQTSALISVAPGFSAQKSVSVISSQQNTNVTVSDVSGNGSFIAPSMTELGTMSDGQSQEVTFTCSPDASQALGYYSEVFSVKSSESPAGQNITVSCSVAFPALTVALQNKNVNASWFGNIIVNATVKDISGSAVAGADVALTVTPPAGRFVDPRTVSMRDDGIAPDTLAGDGIYSVNFDISMNGSAETNGIHAENVTATKSGYASGTASGNFTAYYVRRWSGSQTIGKYANFNVTQNANGTWDHNLTNMRLLSQGAYRNIIVKYPIMNQKAISDLKARGSIVNGYWIENGNVIVLSVNVTGAATGDAFNMSFVAASDLVLTHSDKYETASGIAARDYKNGFLVWNRHMRSEIFGLGLTTEGNTANAPHAIGENVAVAVTDGSETRTVDCMERTGTPINRTGTMAYDTCVSCGSYYPWNIHWINPSNEFKAMGGEIVSMNETYLKFLFASNPSTNEWGSANVLGATKTLAYFSQKKYIEHEFSITNNNPSDLNVSFVWGKEPWIYTPGTQANDTGITPAASGIQREQLYNWTTLGDSWFGQYDNRTFYADIMMFQQNDSAAMPTTCGHFNVSNTPLGTNAGQNMYPLRANNKTTYNGVATMFCDWNLGAMPQGSARTVKFYQWAGKAGTLPELISGINADSNAIKEL